MVMYIMGQSARHVPGLGQWHSCGPQDGVTQVSGRHCALGGSEGSPGRLRLCSSSLHTLVTAIPSLSGRVGGHTTLTFTRLQAVTSLARAAFLPQLPDVGDMGAHHTWLLNNACFSSLRRWPPGALGTLWPSTCFPGCAFSGQQGPAATVTSPRMGTWMP